MKLYLIMNNISKGKWGNKVVFFAVKYLTSLHMLCEEIFFSKIFFTFCTLLWFRFLMKTLVPLKFAFIKKHLSASSTLMFYFFLHTACFSYMSSYSSLMGKFFWTFSTLVFTISKMVFFFCITGGGYLHLAWWLITCIGQENVSWHPTFL